MASRISTLIDLIQTDLESGRAANNFSNNEFKIDRTYFPVTKVKDIHADGQLWITPLGTDDTPASRRSTYEVDAPIQLAFQKRVEDPHNFQEVDLLVQLWEEIRDAVKESIKTDTQRRFSWMRTEALRDENGTIFQYVALREASTFEAFANVIVKAVVLGEAES